MLNRLPKKPVYLFREANQDPITSLHGARRNFERQRKRLAVKLQNPRLMQIHFHSLRHFKATLEYHKTKDILHVMQLLGHKNIRNTLVYTHLVNWESDEFISKVAASQKEITDLIETGFNSFFRRMGMLTLGSESNERSNTRGLSRVRQEN